MPRPVGGDVQHGARGRSVAESLEGKRRMSGQQLRQTGEVSRADQLGERNHHRVVRWEHPVRLERGTRLRFASSYGKRIELGLNWLVVRIVTHVQGAVVRLPA